LFEPESLLRVVSWLSRPLCPGWAEPSGLYGSRTSSPHVVGFVNRRKGLVEAMDCCTWVPGASLSEMAALNPNRNPA